jgi:hypothetical protein
MDFVGYGSVSRHRTGGRVPMLITSFSTLPYPTLPYPTLPYPTLPYPTLPYPSTITTAPFTPVLPLCVQTGVQAVPRVCVKWGVHLFFPRRKPAQQNHHPPISARIVRALLTTPACAVCCWFVPIPRSAQHPSPTSRVALLSANRLPAHRTRGLPPAKS